MSEFPVEGAENGECGGKVAAVMDSLHKKSSQGHLAQSSSTQQANSSSSSSTTTTTSRVAKTSQRMQHHVTSSEMKASSMKSDLSELKSNISEMKNLSAFNRLRSSMEDLVEDGGGGGGGGDPETPPPPAMSGPCPPPPLTAASAAAETLKFEQKRVSSASKTKVVTDAFCAQQASANTAEMKRLQAGEITYQQNTAQSQMRARLEMDALSAEKSVNMIQVNYTLA
ncbi:hypothetical protein AAG570_010144 [Ranatra chinensis]|uniref:Uncharacterized protein n=1 Tax=Ranatra chinensis TaxID=642074 RepID=A0ABD0YZW2_9HEMI